MRTRVAVLLLVLTVVSGCGEDDDAGAAEIRVSAAASLKTAFVSYGDQLAGVRSRFSFAGSDQLAGQIRSGARPDVFAAANAELPAALRAEGLVQEPVAFARNEIVIAVPRDGATVAALPDLAADGIRIAVGARDVPVGRYTREVLGGLPAAQRDAILANVRSEEPDVSGVVGKLATGAADAGFVYRTDVAASGGRLRAIPLPEGLDPTVVLAVAVVTGARAPDAARAFVDGLLDGSGAAALRDAGFLGPP